MWVEMSEHYHPSFAYTISVVWLLADVSSCVSNTFVPDLPVEAPCADATTDVGCLRKAKGIWGRMV